MTAPTLTSSLLLSTALGFGCLASEPPAVPLYPNGETTRLLPKQVADLVGPIGKIDGREVTGLGGRFDLLPGCHVIELDRQSDNSSYALSGAVYITGSFPATTYALRMQAGARYFIKRDTILEPGGATVRVALSAREEAPGGAVTDLSPATSLDDVKACQAWGATIVH
jgi:hypothetical protein